MGPDFYENPDSAVQSTDPQLAEDYARLSKNERACCIGLWSEARTKLQFSNKKYPEGLEIIVSDRGSNMSITRKGRFALVTSTKHLRAARTIFLFDSPKQCREKYSAYKREKNHCSVVIERMRKTLATLFG